MSDRWGKVVGVFGAGRLASALIKRVLQIAGEPTSFVLWSPRGRRTDRKSVFYSDNVQWRTACSQVLREVNELLVAMPAHAFLQEVGDSSRWSGRLFCTSSDATNQVLSNSLPDACCIRWMPFLLPGRDTISSLAFRSASIGDSIFQSMLSQLSLLGNVTVVADENLFNRFWILGAPLPVVVVDSLEKALDAAIGVHVNRSDKVLGENLFWSALNAFIYDRAQEGRSGGGFEAVASPGGVTERGLADSPNVGATLERVFDSMVRHQEVLCRSKTPVRDR